MLSTKSGVFMPGTQVNSKSLDLSSPSGGPTVDRQGARMADAASMAIPEEVFQPLKTRRLIRIGTTCNKSESETVSP